MYPRISWDLVADPLGSTERSLGTAGLAPSWIALGVLSNGYQR